MALPVIGPAAGKVGSALFGTSARAGLTGTSVGAIMTGLNPFSSSDDATIMPDDETTMSFGIVAVVLLVVWIVFGGSR